MTAKTIPITVNGKSLNVKLLLWDTAGNEKYNSVSEAFYRGCQGAFMVYDITRVETFKHCEDWINRLRAVEPDCKILLVGNKVDKEESRAVPGAEGGNIANCYNALFIETSAKSGDNINEAFDMLIRNILEK